MVVSLPVYHVILWYILCKGNLFTVGMLLGVWDTETTYETITVNFDGKYMDSNLGSEQVMVKE